MCQVRELSRISNEAASLRDDRITEPRFSNSGTIAKLYISGIKEEIQCYVFGYITLEKIVRHIREIQMATFRTHTSNKIGSHLAAYFLHKVIILISLWS